MGGATCSGSASCVPAISYDSGSMTCRNVPLEVRQGAGQEAPSPHTYALRLSCRFPAPPPPSLRRCRTTLQCPAAPLSTPASRWSSATSPFPARRLFCALRHPGDGTASRRCGGMELTPASAPAFPSKVADVFDCVYHAGCTCGVQVGESLVDWVAFVEQAVSPPAFTFPLPHPQLPALGCAWLPARPPRPCRQPHCQRHDRP